jgi:hypothetical protein
LHGWRTEHTLVQVLAVASQAVGVGQSGGKSQPQAPPPVTMWQTAPAGLVAQGVQATPVAPQAAAVVPATHMPLASQHPPLQGCDGLQVVVH